MDFILLCCWMFSCFCSLVVFGPFILFYFRLHAALPLTLVRLFGLLFSFCKLKELWKGAYRGNDYTRRRFGSIAKDSVVVGSVMGIPFFILGTAYPYIEYFYTTHKTISNSVLTIAALGLSAFGYFKYVGKN